MDCVNDNCLNPFGYRATSEYPTNRELTLLYTSRQGGAKVESGLAPDPAGDFAGSNGEGVS
jgi:hypothetical protein